LRTVDAGYRVHGLAWTNAVVQDMKRDGFANASTLASEFKRLESGLAKWDSRTVLIEDEAAVFATKHMAELTAKARASGAKLILVGDDEQLASIERGGMFGALRQEHGAAELHEVRRVADAEQKKEGRDENFNQFFGGGARGTKERDAKVPCVSWLLLRFATVKFMQSSPLPELKLFGVYAAIGVSTLVFFFANHIITTTARARFA
jgi:ATP-dependent exoDNAse (exonuclease V) alpha subunit